MGSLLGLALADMLFDFYESEKSIGTTELHYSTKKRHHVLGILKSSFSFDTCQSMKRRIATER